LEFRGVEAMKAPVSAKALDGSGVKGPGVVGHEWLTSANTARAVAYLGETFHDEKGGTGFRRFKRAALE
jgi:hypothetical protein